MIRIEHLTKYYGHKQALNDVTLQIENGVFGLLGLNGAGKTTLMKCLLGLISYKGEVAFSDEKKPLIGYLPQSLDILDALTVYEAMDYLSMLKGFSNNKTQILELIEKVHLSDELKTKTKQLSGGMRRRFGIAQALIGNPKWIVIDEPTAGLDPAERVRFRSLIKQVALHQNVIITSHIVEDIEVLAQQIAILDKGKVKLNGNKDELLSAMNGKVGLVTCTEDDFSKYEEQYHGSIEYQEGQLLHVRIVGDSLPSEARIVEPRVQDLFFYGMQR